MRTLGIWLFGTCLNALKTAAHDEYKIAEKANWEQDFYKAFCEAVHRKQQNNNSSSDDLLTDAIFLHLQNDSSTLAEYAHTYCETNKMDMGNRALLDALRLLAERTPAMPHFQEVISASPDVDADVVRDIASVLKGSAYRTTLYFSANDLPLSLSEFVNQWQRAGQGVIVVPGVDMIDFGPVDGHSAFSENWFVMSDISTLLLHDDPPEKRFLLKQKPYGRLYYWQFEKPQ